MTNSVPPIQTLALKGFKNGTSKESIIAFCKQLTPYSVGENVTKDIKPLNSKYKYMAFLNYSSEEQALLAKDKIESDLKLLKAKGHWMDISHITVVLAVDLSTQACDMQRKMRPLGALPAGSRSCEPVRRPAGARLARAAAAVATTTAAVIAGVWGGFVAPAPQSLRRPPQSGPSGSRPDDHVRSQRVALARLATASAPQSLVPRGIWCPAPRAERRVCECA